MEEVKDTQSLIMEIVELMNTMKDKSKYVERLMNLYYLSEKPCELAVAGKVKAGKSSFLNALLGVDLAMVGTSETTATINYFKYGIPEDPQKPVVVYWNDGREPEPQTKEFLDSLQGYTDDVLDRAEKIDYLEYFLNNKRLKNITLIDTPGVGSTVDAHEQRVANYFRTDSLRKLHEEKSNQLMEQADAVIYISTRVPESSTQNFFDEYIPNISAFNTLGVMTKIDIENDSSPEVINRMVGTLTTKFKKELSTILPVSAGVYHWVNKLDKTGGLVELQNTIRMIPDDIFKKRFIDISSEDFYAKEGAFNKIFDSVGLSHEVRRKMVGDIPWSVFYTIAVALYEKELDEAKRYLIDYSGMENVDKILDKQFFSRSRSIRCARVLREVKQILMYIKNVEIPQLHSMIMSKADYLKIIQSATGLFDAGLLSSFKQFVEKNIPKEMDSDIFDNEIDSLLRKTDKLLQKMEGKENFAEGLQLLEKNQDKLRTTEEIEELELLFGKYPDRFVDKDLNYCAKRQMYWNSREQLIIDDTDYKKLLSLACIEYGKLIANNK